ncbi:hypothetical protein AgCh_008009 [Apium graveolens]
MAPKNTRVKKIKSKKGRNPGEGNQSAVEVMETNTQADGGKATQLDLQSDSVPTTVTTTESEKKRYGATRGPSTMSKLVIKKAQGKKFNNEFKIPKECESLVLKSASTKWRQFKSELTTDYVIPLKGDLKKFVAQRITEQSTVKAGWLKLGEKPVRAIFWKKARMTKECIVVDPDLAVVMKRIDNLLEIKERGEFQPSGSDDVFARALETPEHSGRVRGVGSYVNTKLWFDLPKEKKCRTTKTELEARDRQRDEEMERIRQEMERTKQEMERTKQETKRTKQEMAELKSLISASNLTGSPLSDNARFQEKAGPKEGVKVACVLTKMKEMNIDDEIEYVGEEPPSPEKKAPRSCKLSVDNIKNKVAFGTIFDDPVNFAVHRVPIIIERKDSRRRKKKKNQLQRPFSMFKEVEVADSVPKGFNLLYKHAITIMKETGDSIVIPCDTEVFGCERVIYILHENLIALLKFEEIGQAAISAHMSYLHGVVLANNDLDMFAFFDPGATFTLNKEFERYFVQRLTDGCDRVFLMPYNFNAMKTFNAQTGRGNIVRKIKNLVGYPKQPGGPECGYVVMRYMKDIIEDKEMTFITKWANKSRKSYKMEELDVVRIEALAYIQDKI